MGVQENCSENGQQSIDTQRFTEYNPACICNSDMVKCSATLPNHDGRKITQDMCLSRAHHENQMEYENGIGYNCLPPGAMTKMIIVFVSIFAVVGCIIAAACFYYCRRRNKMTQQVTVMYIL